MANMPGSQTGLHKTESSAKARRIRVECLEEVFDEVQNRKDILEVVAVVTLGSC